MYRKNDTEMYSTHNEGRSVVAERFIILLKNNIYVYINKLDDLVDKYNNTYHIRIKMKPVDRKPSTYIDSYINYQDSKFKIVDS